MDPQPRAVGTFAGRVVLRRWLLACFSLGAFAGLVLFGESASWLWHGALLGQAFSVFLLSLLFAGMTLLQFPERRRGVLRVLPRALFWQDRPLFAGARLCDAIAYTNAERHGVRVRSKWRTTYFEVDTRAQADQIVEALGLDTAHVAAAFEGGIGAVALLPLLLGLAFVANTRISHDPEVDTVVFAVKLALALLLVAGALTLRLARAWWVVGTDGLLVRGAFRRPRFVPYAQIESLQVIGTAVEARLRDGGSLLLHSRYDTMKGSRPIVGVHALMARIQQACARHGTQEPAVVLAPLLARGGRDVATWLRALGRLDDAREPFRVASIPRERLWSAVEDPREQVEIRAAAAGALRTDLREEDRVRMRVAATSCASPRLRVALEAAQSTDEVAFAQALDAVTSEVAEGSSPPYRGARAEAGRRGVPRDGR